MGRLRVAVGESPLAREHARLLGTALRRGRLRPERQPGEEIGGDYSRPARLLARSTWLRRMVHEHQSSAVFARLLPQLIAAEATLDEKTAVLRMAMDELRHAALCGDVVVALGGRAEAEIDLATLPLPEHLEVPPRERALRNLLYVSCLSETVALALLAAEREETREALPRRVLDQLAADESLHARIGWIHLAGVWPRLDAPARARTRAWLAFALRSLDENMLGAMVLPARPPSPALREELHALGVTPADEARDLYRAALTEVVLPRLGACLG